MFGMEAVILIVCVLLSLGVAIRALEVVGERYDRWRLEWALEEADANAFAAKQFDAARRKALAAYIFGSTARRN